MRCSLVSLLPQRPRPSRRGLEAPIRYARLARHLAGVSLCAALAASAQADGGAIYSGIALNNPALPPALASDEHTMLWSQGIRLRNQAVEALSVLREAPAHGLPIDRYALRTLNALAADLGRGNQARQFNELLTAAIETYAIDLLQGLQPSAFEDKRDPSYPPAAGDTVSSQLSAAVLKGLHRSIATNRVRSFVHSIEPEHDDYRKLQSALQQYRALVARGGWPEVPRGPDGATLLPGATDPRVPALRARLAVTDPTLSGSSELAGVADAELYDEVLQQAVVAFQSRHGLTPDGKVGRSTRAALNVTAEERVRQLELNLDRWRLMPKVMPANHIWVNVPQYEMKLQLDREEVLGMRVIVGKSKWPTPMMHDELEQVVFSPYWYPPRKIAVQEILPKVKADPGYLAAQGFEVLDNNNPIDASTINWQEVTAATFNYRFRQRPGDSNSLGDVKFLFPNNYAVYLHDTNAKSLFDKSMRAFSHGCVRLEKPDALAAALMQWDRGWKSEKVQQAMASGRQKTVKLEETVPVYLVYFTATVEAGTVQFHEDIYGHDARHKAQQDQPANTQVAQILARYEQELAVSKPRPGASVSVPTPPVAVQSLDATSPPVTAISAAVASSETAPD